MSQTPPTRETRELAKRLVAYENAFPRSSGDTTALFRVSEKLRRSLSTLAGPIGFRTLLARALTLSKAHVPGLSTVQVTPDGSLDGLSEVVTDAQASEAGALLIAQLLQLLSVFIGESLMRRLVLDVWPDLPALKAEENRDIEHDPTR